MSTENELGIKQIPFRMKRETYNELRTKMSVNGHKFQRIVTAFITSYLNGDVEAVAIVEKKTNSQTENTTVSQVVDAVTNMEF